MSGAGLGELGLQANALLGVGVDRLDLYRGIEEGAQAVELLLERHRVSWTLQLCNSQLKPHEDRQ
jgi:trehalose-6-phosphate synthase